MSEDTFCMGQDAKDAAYEATIRGLIAGWPLARLEQTLKDAKLGAKVRGMAVVTALVRTSLGTYRYHVGGDVVGTGRTPEEALGVGPSTEEEET